MAINRESVRVPATTIREYVPGQGDKVNYYLFACLLGLETNPFACAIEKGRKLKINLLLPLFFFCQSKSIQGEYCLSTLGPCLGLVDDQ